MRLFLLGALSCLVAASLTAQDGTTDGAVGRSSVLLASGRLPSPDEVHVYDFINYHTHVLPEPAADLAVALDARLLSPLPDADADTVLQVGFRTRRLSFKDLRPVNLCVIIDRSGSMADAGKLEHVKTAMERFLAAFDEDDVLSIVAFSTEAEVVVPPARVNDPKAVLAKVKELKPGGGTNLHAGLMLGYEQAARRLDPKRANRVILLSDGMANQGVTDSDAILKDSKAWNGKGLDLTTVGIGLEYNNALMRALADAGRGTYHFLDSATEIERVFGTYLQSLVEKAARSPVCTVTLADGVEVLAVHGYEPKRAGRALTFELLDMPLSLTQVIPIEIRVPAGAKAVAEVKLEYRCERTAKGIALDRAVAAARGKSEEDADVRKNVAIARLAAAVKAACAKPEAAPLQAAVKAAVEAFGAEPKDADLKRVLDLARGTLAIVERGRK
jgi:Mg-chelatase subunit ChlD